MITKIYSAFKEKCASRNTETTPQELGEIESALEKITINDKIFEMTLGENKEATQIAIITKYMDEVNLSEQQHAASNVNNINVARHIEYCIISFNLAQCSPEASTQIKCTDCKRKDFGLKKIAS
jgi:hypothetical protein